MANITDTAPEPRAREQDGMLEVDHNLFLQVGHDRVDAETLERVAASKYALLGLAYGDLLRRFRHYVFEVVKVEVLDVGLAKDDEYADDGTLQVQYQVTTAWFEPYATRMAEYVWVQGYTPDADEDMADNLWLEQGK